MEWLNALAAARWPWQSSRRYFLGRVAVDVPRRKFFTAREVSEAELAAMTIKCLGIQPPTAALPAAPDDHMVDVTLRSVRWGQLLFSDFPSSIAVVFWRPMVKLSFRIYRAGDGRIVSSSSITQKMAWSLFWSRAIAWRAQGVANKADLTTLTEQALQGIASRLRA